MTGKVLGAILTLTMGIGSRHCFCTEAAMRRMDGNVLALPRALPAGPPP